MTTRIEITFPDLDEGEASDAIAWIVEALTNDYGMGQLAHRTNERTRKFEIRLVDPSLASVTGMTYEVQVGAPGTASMTNLGGREVPHG